MRISGFTFIRNGCSLGYPFAASIRSVMPLCDEFIIAVGESSDDTLQVLKKLQQEYPLIRLLETRWNENMQDRGFVYAQQKMIAHYSCTGDWAFYLEGDEVLHEQDIPRLRQRLKEVHNKPEVECLVFDYYHFFGSPEWVAISPGWYRRAPRILRNTLRSYSPDGLYFLVMDKKKQGRYPNAATANVPIYHYGHVRKREDMQRKVEQVSKYWGKTESFDQYDIDPMALAPFTGQHPETVKSWLDNDTETNFQPNPVHKLTSREKKHRWMMKLEKRFGWELSKKHYRLLKDV
ncbi:MAG: glycosyltransferase family 2 protein [Gammaproteobacteria bacterium]|nr:glycosyltransferase family 2 protein [Gammaproteobacteria bacterium]MBU1722345.1 glycosyltransferase family 2 protein [Gammaproteobacteria bacterium]MBU2004718.1 glycosyltransferase family 2 protein [Gammaproteobacteria bacterium]